MTTRLALAALLLVAALLLLARRKPRIPSPAEITAMDEPTFARFLDRIGMTRRTRAALDEPGGGW